ncbi:aminotransferase class V-fold PLP-dependent enzyme [Microbacterium hominis]|nr:aminotransferase class V-fold PLP-dependent enzyme [Microbacterium hominis]
MDLGSFLSTFDAEPGYLDWAAFGPLSTTVRADLHADAELLGAGRASGIELVAEHEPEARELLADLLDADVEQVTLQPSTTYGLMHALYGLAGSLMLSRAEFPSLTVPATRAADALGSLELQWLELTDGFVTPDVVRTALSEETTALAVSLVDFRTGYRADLSALREVIGDRLLIVDAIQGFGIVEADYAAADVVCGNGYKWLRAGRGTGFARFGERALERLAPVLSGFTGTDRFLPVDEVPLPAASAAAFTVSRPDHLAVTRLAGALGDITAVGVPVLEDALTEIVGDVMLVADRYEVPVITPRDPARRAGIVTLAPAAQDAAPLAAALANHGLTVSVQSGRVRVSPHVGTGSATITMFGDALAEFSAARVW